MGPHGGTTVVSARTNGGSWGGGGGRGSPAAARRTDSIINHAAGGEACEGSAEERIAYLETQLRLSNDQNARLKAANERLEEEVKVYQEAEEHVGDVKSGEVQVYKTKAGSLGKLLQETRKENNELLNERHKQAFAPLPVGGGGKGKALLALPPSSTPSSSSFPALKGGAAAGEMEEEDGEVVVGDFNGIQAGVTKEYMEAFAITLQKALNAKSMSYLNAGDVLASISIYVRQIMPHVFKNSGLDSPASPLCAEEEVQTFFENPQVRKFEKAREFACKKEQEEEVEKEGEEEATSKKRKTSDRKGAAAPPPVPATAAAVRERRVSNNRSSSSSSSKAPSTIEDGQDGVAEAERMAGEPIAPPLSKGRGGSRANVAAASTAPADALVAPAPASAPTVAGKAAATQLLPPASVKEVIVAPPALPANKHPAVALLEKAISGKEAASSSSRKQMDRSTSPPTDVVVGQPQEEGLETMEVDGGDKGSRTEQEQDEEELASDQLPPLTMEEQEALPSPFLPPPPAPSTAAASFSAAGGGSAGEGAKRRLRSDDAPSFSSKPSPASAAETNPASVAESAAAGAPSASNAVAVATAAIGEDASEKERKALIAGKKPNRSPLAIQNKKVISTIEQIWTQQCVDELKYRLKPIVRARIQARSKSNSTPTIPSPETVDKELGTFILKISKGLVKIWQHGQNRPFSDNELPFHSVEQLETNLKLTPYEILVCWMIKRFMSDKEWEKVETGPKKQKIHTNQKDGLTLLFEAFQMKAANGQIVQGIDYDSDVEDEEEEEETQKIQPRSTSQAGSAASHAAMNEGKGGKKKKKNGGQRGGGRSSAAPTEGERRGRSRLDPAVDEEAKGEEEEEEAVVEEEEEAEEKAVDPAAGDVAASSATTAAASSSAELPVIASSSSSSSSSSKSSAGAAAGSGGKRGRGRLPEKNAAAEQMEGEEMMVNAEEAEGEKERPSKEEAAGTKGEEEEVGEEEEEEVATTKQGRGRSATKFETTKIFLDSLTPVVREVAFWAVRNKSTSKNERKNTTGLAVDSYRHHYGYVEGSEAYKTLVDAPPPKIGRLGFDVVKRYSTAMMEWLNDCSQKKGMAVPQDKASCAALLKTVKPMVAQGLSKSTKRNDNYWALVYLWEYVFDGKDVIDPKLPTSAAAAASSFTSTYIKRNAAVAASSKLRESSEEEDEEEEERDGEEDGEEEEGGEEEEEEEEEEAKEKKKKKKGKKEDQVRKKRKRESDESDDPWVPPALLGQLLRSGEMIQKIKRYYVRAMGSLKAMVHEAGLTASTGPQTPKELAEFWLKTKDQQKVRRIIATRDRINDLKMVLTWVFSNYPAKYDLGEDLLKLHNKKTKSSFASSSKKRTDGARRGRGGRPYKKQKKEEIEKERGEETAEEEEEEEDSAESEEEEEEEEEEKEEKGKEKKVKKSSGQLGGGRRGRSSDTSSQAERMKSSSSAAPASSMSTTSAATGERRGGRKGGADTEVAAQRFSRGESSSKKRGRPSGEDPFAFDEVDDQEEIERKKVVPTPTKKAAGGGGGPVQRKREEKKKAVGLPKGQEKQQIEEEEEEEEALIDVGEEEEEEEEEIRTNPDVDLDAAVMNGEDHIEPDEHTPELPLGEEETPTTAPASAQGGAAAHEATTYRPAYLRPHVQDEDTPELPLGPEDVPAVQEGGAAHEAGGMFVASQTETGAEERLQEHGTGVSGSASRGIAAEGGSTPEDDEMQAGGEYLDTNGGGKLDGEPSDADVSVPQPSMPFKLIGVYQQHLQDRTDMSEADKKRHYEYVKNAIEEHPSKTEAESKALQTKLTSSEDEEARAFIAFVNRTTAAAESSA